MCQRVLNRSRTYFKTKQLIFIILLSIETSSPAVRLKQQNGPAIRGVDPNCRQQVYCTLSRRGSRANNSIITAAVSWGRVCSLHNLHPLRRRPNSYCSGIEMFRWEFSPPNSAAAAAPPITNSSNSAENCGRYGGKVQFCVLLFWRKKNSQTVGRSRDWAEN